MVFCLLCQEKRGKSGFGQTCSELLGETILTSVFSASKFWAEVPLHRVGFQHFLSVLTVSKRKDPDPGTKVGIRRQSVFSQLKKRAGVPLHTAGFFKFFSAFGSFKFFGKKTLIKAKKTDSNKLFSGLTFFF